MARPKPQSRVLSRFLWRPYALANRPQEIWFAGGCIALLALVFVADILTPVQIAVSALGLIPLLAAMWVLSFRLAMAVATVALGQLVVTGLMGRLTLATVAAEGTAYVLLALLCRLYAGSMADLFFRSARPGRDGQETGRGPSVALTVAGKRSARGLDTLTERERQVSQLAAQGYTAREIGTALHIGRRTVETHLANAYDKLGVRSKRELMRLVSAGDVAAASGSTPAAASSMH